jgi:hypothetical protein
MAYVNIRNSSLLKKWTLVVAFMGTMSATVLTHAAIYLEPAVGVGMSGKIDLSSEKPDLSGTVYGLKLGYSKLGLALGGEYSTGQYNYKQEDGLKVTTTPTDLGVFVSYTFPIMFKVQASYLLSSSMTLKDLDTKIQKGSGTKVGVGFTGFPFVAVNVDYLMNEYKEVETAGVTAELSDKIKTNMVLVSVSVPLSF